MKTLSRRALSLLLAVLLLVSALPMATAAEDSAEDFVGDTAEERIEQAIGEPMEEPVEESVEELAEDADPLPEPEETAGEIPEDGEALLSMEVAIDRPYEGPTLYGNTEPAVYIPPFFADVITEADVLEAARSRTDETHFITSQEGSETDPVYDADTMAGAVARLREGLADWGEPVSLRYYSEDILHELFTDPKDNIEKFRLDANGEKVIFGIYNLMLEEFTGVCTEGDYLLYELGAYYVMWNVESTPEGCWIYEFTYQPLPYASKEQEEELAVKADQILAELNLTGLSDYEKVYRIYRYIVTHVSYDYANLNKKDYLLKYTAYAALVNNTAVCAGYSSAFYRLAVAAGVETRIVNSMAMDHAWNIVLLDGTPYMLDSTWDEHVKEADWRYFLRGSTYWQKKHVVNGKSELGEQFNSEDGKFRDRYTPSTADFAAPVWTIRYDANGGAAAPVPQVFAATPKTSGTNRLYQAKASATVTSEAPASNSLDVAFRGWSEDPAATRATVAPGKELTLTDTKTLYAVWQSKAMLASGTLGDNISWMLTEDGMLIFAGEGAVAGEWATPEDVPWYALRESVTAVFVPDTVDSVGDYAFAGCTALETVTLPDTLESLGAYAFSGCAALQEITLPAALESLNEGTFAGCTALTTVALPKEITSIAEDAFTGVALSVEYPCSSGCWTADTMQNYGGTLQWVISHDESVTTKQATCTADGEIVAVCRDCGRTETTAIPAIGHAYQAQVTAPTCTEGGFTRYVCTYCDDSYPGEEVEPLGHDVVRGACTRCSYTEYCLVLTAPETLVAKKSVALKAELLPYNMTRTSFVWSITDGAEYATLSSSGKLTAKAVTEQHTVTVRVATKDGAVEPVECTVTLLPKVTSVRILQDGAAVTGLTLDYNLRDEASVPIVLTADAFPTDATQTIQWTCSDKKSAYCCWELAEDGTLTVVPSGTGKVGTVTFTAAATDGSGKKAKVKVKFSNIALEGDLAITNTISRVTSGKKLKLTYAFTPIKPTVNKLVWSIDPEGAAYASVSSSGVVTAKKGLGTAEDGSYYRVTITAALKSNPAVQVSIELEIIPAVTSVSILLGEGENAQVVSGAKLTVSCEEPLQLSAAATPEKALQEFTWKSSNAGIATVSADSANCTVTFTGKKGTVKITATAADGTAKKAYVTLVVQ